MEQFGRTYIHYSDEKILEQRQQIPLSRWENVKQRLSAAEVTTLRSGAKISMVQPGEETILSSLYRVWADLDDQGMIGTFDDPKEYVYGILVFNYGIFDMFDPPLFVLAGATDRTTVVLGGRKEYVRGFRNREIRLTVGAVPVVMEPDIANLLYASDAASPGVPTESQMAAPGEDLRAGYAAKLYEDWNWQGSKMEYEVLARKELFSRASPPFVEEPKNVLVGALVFVAQA